VTGSVIRVLLADDENLLRRAIASLLDMSEDVAVVAQASDGAEAVALAAEHDPDVVLLDLEMPRLDGLEAARRILARRPEQAVVLLTRHARAGVLRAALAAGVRGFLPKSVDPGELERAIVHVHGGPFDGMVYGPLAADKALLPRLLGAYERETYPAVEKIVARDPDVIVVAGTGEGFFAVGLARRLPKARIVGFELMRFGRYLTRRHARLNGVAERIELYGLLTAQTLERSVKMAINPVLVLDIEGGEQAVLDPIAAPSLAKTTVLVELHPMFVEGIEETILSRFSASHDIETMRMGDRTLEHAPPVALDGLSEADALWAINEKQFRGPTGTWLLMTPKPA